MATNTYLSITGIPGDSPSRAFPKQFEVLSLSFGASLAVSSGGGGGGGTGKATFTSVTATIRDYNLPLFLKTLPAGKHLQSAVFSLVEATDATATAFETITLSDVILSGLSYSQAGDTPILELTFAYTKIGIASTHATLASYTYDISRGTGG